MEFRTKIPFLFSGYSILLFIYFKLTFTILMQIQSEGHSLQLGVKDALLNALLVAAKRFSSGPPQVLQISLD
jgi:hypothetical protein